MIFNSIYGKGGEKEVSDADLKTYYAENYQHIQYFSISIKDLEGDDLQKRKDLANEMIGRARDGEDFVSLCRSADNMLYDVKRNGKGTFKIKGAKNM